MLTDRRSWRDLLLLLYEHLDGTSERRWSKPGPRKRASQNRRSSRHPLTRIA